MHTSGVDPTHVRMYIMTTVVLDVGHARSLQACRAGSRALQDALGPVPRAANIADAQPATGRARYRDITCWPDMPPVRAHVPRVAPSWLPVGWLSHPRPRARLGRDARQVWAMSECGLERSP
jgi:hypothetical protein